MSDHNSAVFLGTDAGLAILEVLRTDVKFAGQCELCLVRGVTMTLLATVLVANEVPDDEIEDYMDAFAAAVLTLTRHAKKEADQSDPPQSPDKRTLN